MKIKIKAFVLLLVTSAFICSVAYASSRSISVSGVVRQPLNLSLEDLHQFQTVRVQLNEVLKDRSYRGAWYYRGVTLRTLLETAFIEKEESSLKKPLDLAILVRNREGKEVALSWGEIFYKNSHDIIIATSATPIRPKDTCSRCHSPEKYEPYMKQFDREPGFPKLVVGSDMYSDRSIENVVSIEVVNTLTSLTGDRSSELYSPSFVVTGKVNNELTIKDLSDFTSRRSMTVINVGEGKGFHGIDDYSGVLFSEILKKADIGSSLSQVFHVYAPDGYRAVYSYGEIFLHRVEDSIIIADTRNGKKIEKDGRFIFVPSDDLMADRDIKAVQKIEVLELKRTPGLTFIGLGCADTDLITHEAITAMARADAFICPPDIEKRFSKYMGDKPVLFDIYNFIPPLIKKQNPEFTADEVNDAVENRRIAMADAIRAELEKGMNIAILDYGDPTIWSGTEYIWEHFDKDMFDIIPGLSSFNVASALLKRHTGCRGSIIMTNSRGILENKPLFEAAAKHGDMVSIFMAMHDLPEILDFFNETYKADTPVHIVYRAGYSDSEKIVITDIKGLGNRIESEKEKNLFLVFIGPCLDISAKAHRH